MNRTRTVWRAIALVGTVCLLITGCTEAETQAAAANATHLGREVLQIVEQEIARRAGATSPADTPTKRLTDAEIEATLLRLTNDERAQAGLPRLTLDASLSALARARSAEMAARGYYGHFDPQTGARLHPADTGENLDRVRPLVLDERVPAEIIGDWIRSAEHRHTLLNGSYTRIGVGIAISAGGMLYVTQLFK